MKIAIDLNDVVRDFSNNFVRYYIEGYDHKFDLTDFEFWSHDLSAVFPFKSQNAYYNFIYNDYAFELYGKPIEVMFVSPKEYGLSIGNTYFFLSKLGTKIREVYFPTDSITIWDKCDILFTANPELLESKPEGKISVKIKTEYNKEVQADYSFKDLSTFLTNNENTEKLLNEFIQ